MCCLLTWRRASENVDCYPIMDKFFAQKTLFFEPVPGGKFRKSKNEKKKRQAICCND